MQNSLASLSNELAQLVETFQSQVVAVHARSRYPSSGVLWRPGLIVTADHTIRREEDIQIALHDGKTVDATLAGRDAGTDLAILKAEGVENPSARAPRGETPKAGELVLVIGRSPASGPNASLGVISAFSGAWRTWRGGRLDHYIRLDTTLFPNSSGGAVIDCRGHLLGIATAGLSRLAGLAIPASSIDRVADTLLAKGHVPRAYLGIGVQPVEIPKTLQSKLSTAPSGVMVVSVEPEGPAGQAGVLLGDVFLELGSAPIKQLEDLQGCLDSEAIGKQVKAKFLRAGELRELQITIGERPGK